MEKLKVTKICQHGRVYTWVKKDTYACRDCGRIVKKEDFCEKTEVEKTKWYTVAISSQEGERMEHHIPEKYMDDVEAVSDVFIDCYKDFIEKEELDCLQVD